MQYITRYDSPLGEIMITADGCGMTGLWFVGQRATDPHLGGQRDPNLSSDVKYLEKVTPILEQTKRWLNIYFSGEKPDFMPPLNFTGTDFQKEVWEILCTIGYGQTMTYGEIAEMLARKHGITKMSAQAVGGAVGKNKISIIVPCHRVLGAGGKLTGYAGGVYRKSELLELEGIRHCI